MVKYFNIPNKADLLFCEVNDGQLFVRDITNVSNTWQDITPDVIKNRPEQQVNSAADELMEMQRRFGRICAVCGGDSQTGHQGLCSVYYTDLRGEQQIEDGEE